MSRQTKVWTVTGAVIGVLLYLGCVLWDLLVPGYAMNTAWAPLFRGFSLSGVGFVLALLESAAYGALLGWLVAWVPETVARVVR